MVNFFAFMLIFSLFFTDQILALERQLSSITKELEKLYEEKSRVADEQEFDKKKQDRIDQLQGQLTETHIRKIEEYQKSNTRELADCKQTAEELKKEIAQLKTAAKNLSACEQMKQELQNHLEQLRTSQQELACCKQTTQELGVRVRRLSTVALVTSVIAAALVTRELYPCVVPLIQKISSAS